MNNMLSQLVQQAVIEWLKDKETYFPNEDEVRNIQAIQIHSIEAWTRPDGEPLIEIYFSESEHMRNSYRHCGALAEFWFEVVGL